MGTTGLGQTRNAGPLLTEAGWEASSRTNIFLLPQSYSLLFMVCFLI